MSFTLLNDNTDSEDKKSKITAAIYAADQLLLQWQSNTDLWQQLLQQVFGCTADIDLGDITVEILDSNIMAGMRGAYAPVAPDGDERIYINGDWLKSASNIEIKDVVLEELGHAIDQKLNGNNDTAGDEGAIFAALIQDRAIDVSELHQNDASELFISGRRIKIEASSISNPTAVASITDGVGSFDTLDYAFKVSTVVIGDKTYALVAAYLDNGVQIIDISDPAAPTAVASITDGVGGFDELGGAVSVATVVISSKTYALVAAWSDDGLQIIDISNPASPTAVASITDGGSDGNGDTFDELDGASGVTTAVIGGANYALVAALNDDGLQIINIEQANPMLSAASYDASTGILAVTGTNLASNSGALNDIDVSKLTLTGEANNTYTLTSADVELTSATAFSVTLNTSDQLQAAGLLNKNGTSSGGGTTYNIAAALNWNPGASSSPADNTGNAITVSNVTAPTLTSATYNDTTGVLTVTGSNLPAYSGSNNDIDISKLTITGQGGSTHTLTSSDVELSSSTEFSITLNGADQLALAPLVNKNGTMSFGGDTYNIAAAEDWAPGADVSSNIADLTGNGLTASNTPNQLQVIPNTTTAIDLDGPSSSPSNERVAKGFDGSITTKYLNFGEINSGVEFSFSSELKLTNFEIYTANDANVRDPASYEVYGSSDAGTSFSSLATGTLSLPTTRYAAGGLVDLSISSFFSTYRLVFPTVRNASSANSMQLAELIFYGAANSAPVITGASDTLAFIEGDGATVIDASLTITDADHANIGSATITISSGFQSTEDSLAFTDTNGITGTWNSSDGVLTLSGSATKAQYETALESVTYNNISQNPNTTNRTIKWLVNDGNASSSNVTSTITVARVNDAPTGSVTISGTATEDETLNASNTLADDDGLGTISYQWNRAGSAIDDATGSTYTLAQADVGSAITVTASYTDEQGIAESVTSSATSAVANVNEAFDKIVNFYPFNGTNQEIEEFEDTLTGFEKHVLDNFPQNVGYLVFSGTQKGESAANGTQIVVSDIEGSAYPAISRNATGRSHLDPKENPFTISLFCKILQILICFETEFSRRISIILM